MTSSAWPSARPIAPSASACTREAQAILAIDVPWVPLAHSKVVFAERTNIRGLVVQPSAMGLYRWAEHVE